MNKLAPVSDNVNNEESDFVKPYYIEELGEEGLMASDIAKALGVSIKRVHERLNRSFTKDCEEIEDWRLVAIATAIDTGTYTKREGTTYAFNIKAAKAFVATYRNKRGRLYLNFLFDCEKIATELVPKLNEEIKKLRDENKKFIALPPPKKKSKPKDLIDCYTFQGTLFEGEFELVPIKKHRSEATEFDMDMHRLKHCSKIGINNLKTSEKIMLKYSGSSNPLQQTVVKALAQYKDKKSEE